PRGGRKKFLASHFLSFPLIRPAGCPGRPIFPGPIISDHFRSPGRPSRTPAGGAPRPVYAPNPARAGSRRNKTGGGGRKPAGFPPAGFRPKPTGFLSRREGPVMRYRPSFEEFAELTRAAGLVPVYRQLTGDTLTPVSAFCKVQEGDWAFLFESVV